MIQSSIPSLLIEGESSLELAKEWAQSYLCETQSNCGSCWSCRQLDKGAHPDLLISSESLRMEELRDLLYQWRLRPAYSAYRLLLIADLDHAHLSVQNALLKPLEEPLPNRRLLLAVKSSKSLLATIRSRCLRISQPGSFTSNAENVPDEWLSLIRHLENADEWISFPQLDILLKGREDFRDFLRQSALIASKKGWPGHWRSLAPHLEEAIAHLDRNLNPRIVWDQLITKSYERPLI